STNHDNDPEILDREKRRNLSREKYQTTAPMDHAPGWNEHLATTSEHAVKADATPGGPPSEDLQAQTVQHLQKKHSPEERYTSEAVYERDEISGPLGSAKSIEADASEEVGRVDGEWRQTMVKERTEEEVVKEGDPTSSEAHVSVVYSLCTRRIEV
ncbi:uncharacterized protein STEHIDRAFT_48368, partial [Stereum hirsutum FP-91666 SS1]|uniref:uncharacterized protein n=1 Tax=Stereum hirsutum (strain FP-91666) TaxID=721885 RepID=UPI000440C42A